MNMQKLWAALLGRLGLTGRRAWTLFMGSLLAVGTLGCEQKPSPVEEPKAVTKPGPVAQAGAVAEPTPAAEPETIAKPRPVAEEPKPTTARVIFSRKKDESVVINDNEIVVTVVKIGADEVWLRTEASKKAAVNRRKLHESVNISPNVLFTVVEIRGDSVRLAFKSPKEVRVHRREVYEAIKRQMSERN